MGLLDGMLGGAVGAGLETAIQGYIQKHGGMQAVISQFQQQGLGSTIQSWIGNGPNEPISPDQVHKVMGQDTLKDLAAKAGMTPDELAHKLSEILPKAVDHMTPNGQVV